MPVYEYRCTSCQHLFEVVHAVGGTSGPCPVCGGPAQRVFTSVGLIFKGSGFHTTDYRQRTAAGAGDGPKADGGTGTKGAGAEAASKGT
ncbi:MAG TPA: FmdB family zinc ribbon protein [bacterium]|nr:FmdB family zinc ribbon protein [bacterium]